LHAVALYTLFSILVHNWTVEKRSETSGGES
jgi:hypothetical protein